MSDNRFRPFRSCKADGTKRLLAALLAGLGATPATAAESPVALGFSYTTDVLANVAGGLDQGAAWLGRADVTLEASGSSVGVDGGRLFIDIIYTHGPDFSGNRVGDAQVVSNVQGDGILRPYEAYVELPVAGGASVKLGLIDLNTEFDVQSVGTFFTNSSHGIGIDFSQSGANGPSIFPVTSTAILLKWEGKNGSARAGLFNAVSGDPDRPTRLRLPYPGRDGALLVVEASARISSTVCVQVGTWAYTSPQAVIGGVADARARGSKGAYGQVEWTLLDRGDDNRMASWVRIGTADATSNRVTSYVGGGVTYGGEAERVGLAIAHARQSDRAARLLAADEGPQGRAETSVELGYTRRVASFLTVQPVVHYVLNPGWRRDVEDAFVAGVRFSFRIESRAD